MAKLHYISELQTSKWYGCIMNTGYIAHAICVFEKSLGESFLSPRVHFVFEPFVDMFVTRCLVNRPCEFCKLQELLFVPSFALWKRPFALSRHCFFFLSRVQPTCAAAKAAMCSNLSPVHPTATAEAPLNWSNAIRNIPINIQWWLW